ncbi:MAG: Glutaconyl-CoA decarboxylase subunit gamma [Pelotomaculum sp. PtaB.Bin013]|uniref:Biotin/lipoyl-binding protein n=1 Tax=Pelotomaculum isophthalicicum JI TaxID=947010 RepID=A0A9X4JWA9_9FIRM|nr:biotin/lipoyl-containing protein [Pelotomaculum isophthalicicum]MDF9408788.1 biotin/lipoyl-binding protein [Pelotomaculum isophthalicicum JI]OPX91884.1 MAG: Glutaconyl-CoA decarboxylase subunit gamma [Pelotomaculum sp. PtaB.Bin013]
MAEKSVVTPIPGRVGEVKVKPGDQVKKGDILLIVEAMKMQNQILSQYDGVVKDITVTTGQTVNSNETLVVISEN